MKLKSATRFTLFSTLLMTAANSVFFMVLTLFLREKLGDAFDGFESFLWIALLVMLVVTALASFFISSLVVDRILNPVRFMSAAVREIGKQHFTGRLVIDSDDDELVEYAAAFNDMSLSINGYIKKQKQFVSDASHELSTPITIINGHADQLLRWGKEDPALLVEGLTVIKDEALRMNGLVEDLLFFARSDDRRQVYHKEPVDLRLWLDDWVNEARVLHPGYEMAYHNHCTRTEPHVCDADALRRVFRILLDNAVKYGADGKCVGISAEDFTNGRFRLTVTDRGPGIAPEHLARIFDRFYRADDSRTKKTGGTGLGLAIAKEIVENHGGKLCAANAAEGGAVFTVELP